MSTMDVLGWLMLIAPVTIGTSEGTRLQSRGDSPSDVASSSGSNTLAQPFQNVFCPPALNQYGLYCPYESSPKYYVSCWPPSGRLSLEYKRYGDCPAGHVCRPHDPNYEPTLFNTLFGPWAKIVCVPEETEFVELARLRHGWHRGLHSDHESSRTSAGKSWYSASNSFREDWTAMQLSESGPRGTVITGISRMDQPSTSRAPPRPLDSTQRRRSQGIVIREDLAQASFSAAAVRGHGRESDASSDWPRSSLSGSSGEQQLCASTNDKGKQKVGDSGRISTSSEEEFFDLDPETGVVCEPLTGHTFRAGEMVTLTLTEPVSADASSYVVWSVVGKQP